MSTSTTELISIAESLPFEMRAEIVNKILETMQPSTEEIDALWVAEAERRSQEIKSGKVKTIPGHVVFEKVKKRFSR